MTNDNGTNAVNRVSVWVVEAGYDDSVTRTQEDSRMQPTRELAILTQQMQEDVGTFAARVTHKVERLSRMHAAPERLALVLQDDLTPSQRRLPSEALASVALHLMQSQTQLTIRIAE